MSRAQIRHTQRRTGIKRLTSSVLQSRKSLRPSQEGHNRGHGVFGGSLILAMLIFLTATWPFARAHLQAIAILKVLSRQPVPPIVGATVAVPIHTEDITFDVPAEGGQRLTMRGRLYIPDSKPNAPALVVLHGVHHLGIDEPRLEAFAAAMAKCGIRVLTPELPEIKDYHVDANSVRMIGESTRWFAQQAGAPVGVIGLSFSGGLALIAAADPEFKAGFKFVLAVGSQDSMARVTEYYRNGTDQRPDGSVETLTPHEYGPTVLEYEHVEDFVAPGDVAAVRGVLREHLYEDRPAERASLVKLTDAQRKKAIELMDISSETTQGLIADSNERHADELLSVSPHRILGSLTTPVYLLHGEADNIIPSAETLWMATELPHRTLKAMLVSPVISHIDFESSQPTAMDQWRLIHFFALVVHAAEAKR